MKHQPILISIPLWCDWKKVNIAKQFNNTLISIPLWCDWKFDLITFGHSFGSNFNSFMVRLEDLFLPFEPRIVCYFNSFMVRLEVYTCSGIRPLFCLFQFLYGAIGRNLFNGAEADEL
jgi:hypothetical protein